MKRSKWLLGIERNKINWDHTAPPVGLRGVRFLRRVEAENPDVTEDQGEAIFTSAPVPVGYLVMWSGEGTPAGYEDVSHKFNG